ncbi:NADH-ubiquinone oxidoreductase chain 5 [Gryllus bimaculatus]|nr:NADH-ubiquinone oxidoreductase chain 5 [Gryllus bimaculatus]
MFLIALISFFGAAYRLFLFSYSQHGINFSGSFSYFNENVDLWNQRIILDYKSLLFMRFLMYSSSLVIYYRDRYMIGDYNLSRFIILVLIFVLSMMFLIISPNLIRILLGWDDLGLVSYCLVIYYQNLKSYNAGIIRALSNRIGDVALLLSIA